VEHRAVVFDQTTVEAALRAIPLSGLRVFQTVTSTNDEALGWALSGAADLSLVVADEQTAGRGRSGRSWSTPSGSALALSMILRGLDAQAVPTARLAGLGAMAVVDACDTLGLAASIKWPNDVLLQSRKAAGVLVDALWSGNALDATVVGIGINVLAASTSRIDAMRYPATSMEACMGVTPDRIEVLRLVVAAMVERRAQLPTESFMQSWRGRLAFRGQDVTLTREGWAPIRGRVDGLEEDGSLRLITLQGARRFPMGELHLVADDTID
jgi:BirA family transcriptional regulator, biotin operon repressor / biotin---[acetyl-CoA-carboxylase] ligase